MTALHRTSGRWKLGLALSLMAALNWGFLPIALKKVIEVMDPLTVTWYRFASAAVALGLYVIWRGGVGSRGFGTIRNLRGKTLALAVAATVLLSANYLLYIYGLDFLMPNTAQVVIQLAPIFLLLGGLAVFRERFNLFQWAGLAIFTGGLALFFNDRLGDLLSGLTGYTAGILLIVAAAFVWGVYGLMQKQLLRAFPPQTIMCLLFLACGLTLIPWARPAQVLEMDGMQLGMLGFCAFNSLLAYGCFVEALEHWEASRISAVLATTPLFTVAAIAVGAPLFPEMIDPDPLNALSLAGAFLVVGGSMLTALGRGSRGAASRDAPPPDPSGGRSRR